MSQAAHLERLPTRWQAGLFWLKTRFFRVQRSWREIGQRAQHFEAKAGDRGTCVAESRTPLYTGATAAEFMLQAGKVQNLRLAARRIDGITIPAGAVFSFWAQVGRPARARGFAPGRELREGCIVPSIGGGLCQLSNGLYEAALHAGCEIVERHAHSQRLPGSMAALGRDATVFWNYVDLRFRPRSDSRLEVTLTRDELIVRLYSLDGVSHSPAPMPVVELPRHEHPAESCETCGVADCYRHAERPEAAHGLTAWLVDGWWPEFDQFLREHHQPEDWLFAPLASPRLQNYRWSRDGFARVRTESLETLRRSIGSRRLAAQGAARQRALLSFDQRLAQRFAKRLPVAATHLIVNQNLLPHLWAAGALGGRTFDVLMTRLPIAALQATLNRAAARHPQSPTLADFRAPAALACAEAEALAEARHWITPHSAIAALASPRAIKLAWKIPPRSTQPGSGADTILFPASTLARAGAYELAHAARELNLRIQLRGPVLEPACWTGVQTTREGRPIAVVLPAWVAHQPRALLNAVAAGLPVIATENCGLAGVPGVTTIPEGDTACLINALSDVLRDVAPSPAAALLR